MMDLLLSVSGFFSIQECPSSLICQAGDRLPSIVSLFWTKFGYVGCTRAMRYLFIAHDRSLPSPFLKGLSDDRWLRMGRK